jgi:23S rRNA (guanosine2251-2'-O)-methyltransferase
MLSIVIMLSSACYTVTMNEPTLRLILADLRGAGNVGSILRTADACGVEHVYACGYTPYPRVPNDSRPPHVIAANMRTIAKTALGAEQTMGVSHCPDTSSAIAEAIADGFDIIIIEQAETSLNLFSFKPGRRKLALVFGNEVSGVEQTVLDAADFILEIPMLGAKESLGVAVAAGVALYALRFGS